mmetsp:Transcript_32633/g.97167  ORF Transcript_32633/g.97167 Transcript_32633/m.97167 type:complete len:291 (+) Transcript_32633:114-986(+)
MRMRQEAAGYPVCPHRHESVSDTGPSAKPSCILDHSRSHALIGPRLAHPPPLHPAPLLAHVAAGQEAFRSTRRQSAQRQARPLSTPTTAHSLSAGLAAVTATHWCVCWRSSRPLHVAGAGAAAAAEGPSHRSRYLAYSIASCGAASRTAARKAASPSAVHVLPSLKPLRFRFAANSGRNHADLCVWPGSTQCGGMAPLFLFGPRGQPRRILPQSSRMKAGRASVTPTTSTLRRSSSAFSRSVLFEPGSTPLANSHVCRFGFRVANSAAEAHSRVYLPGLGARKSWQIPGP